jgi:ankyrin repeat protein
MFSLLQKKGVTKKEIHKFIKKTGKDILSTKDESGQTIVHICASEGKIDILDFLLNKYKNNLNLDMKDNLGWTPLVCAAHNAQLSAIELLLKHNADPNIKTNDEAICLHYFAKIKVNSKDVGYYTSVAKQLVKKISNLDVQNKIGETPLHKVPLSFFVFCFSSVSFFIHYFVDDFHTLFLVIRQRVMELLSL